MMRWKVEVYGHSFDLADLVDASLGVGARALKEQGKWFVHADSFEQMDTAAQVHDAAQAIIATINAALQLSDTAAQPLTVGPVIDANGAASHIVSAAGRASGRSRAVGASVPAGGTGMPTAAPAAEPILARRTRLIASDRDVAHAVSLLNNHDDTLGSLAKAYEIVKGDLGNGNQKLGGKRAAAISGASELDLLCFLDNAACPTLSGNLARHAGKNKDRQPKPTARPMDHAEATALIRRVVMAWTDGKL